MKKRLNIISLAFCLSIVALTGCSGYSKLLKSPDADLKFNAAKNLYLEHKYKQSIELSEGLMNDFRGTPKAEPLLYLLSCSYMGLKDYMSASDYFDTYLRNFPRGEYAETARYLIAYCYYKDSPDVRLDQTATENAIYSFSEYLEYYPAGVHATEAMKYMTEMEDKLSYKNYLAAKLYYDLGLYGGNNYRACIVTAECMLKDYPDSKYREDAVFIILKSKYKEASLSVEEKIFDRYSEVVDEYYRYANEFPNGKYIKEANQILKSARKAISKKEQLQEDEERRVTIKKKKQNKQNNNGKEN